VEWKFSDRGATGITRRQQRHGGAVRRRMRDDARRNATTAAGVVLHRDGLAEPLGHLVGEQASDNVGAAARRGADQDAERALRPVLLRQGRQRRARGKSYGERKRATSIWQHG